MSMVEISSKAIKISQPFKDKQLMGLGKVVIEQANALQLVPQFAPQSFDRYIANLCLHLVPDADAMMREAYRVCKPQALVGFTIFGSEENSTLFREHYAALDEAGLGGIDLLSRNQVRVITVCCGDGPNEYGSHDCI